MTVPVRHEGPEAPSPAAEWRRHRVGVGPHAN
jgi:hypothetical protein